MTRVPEQPPIGSSQSDRKTVALANASGQLGWYATKGDQTYFCPIKTASAYIDSKRMYKFTSSGDAIEIDRQVFDSYIGGSDPNIPTWKDVQIGHVKPADVKPCVPSK